MARAGCVRGDERYVYLRFYSRRELYFRLFRRLVETLSRERVIAYINAGFLFELIRNPIHYLLVEVFPAQVRVAVGRAHFNDIVPYLEDRYIECAAAEVEHGYLLVLFLIESVRKRGGCRFVDDALHVGPRYFSGVLGGLPLGVIEIRRNGDDRLRYLLAEFRLRIRLQLLEYHRRYFFRTVPLVSHFDLDAAISFSHFVWRRLAVFPDRRLIVGVSDEAFNLIDSVLRICDGLTAREKPHKALPCFRNGDDRGGRARTFSVLNNFRFPALDYSHC